MARPMDETLMIRLARLAAAELRSREAHSDDVRALHAVCREAEDAGKSVRWIAKLIGFSSTQTHRILSGLTGPEAAA